MGLRRNRVPSDCETEVRFGSEPEVVASFDQLVGARVSTCGRDDEVERLSNLLGSNQIQMQSAARWEYRRARLTFSRAAHRSWPVGTQFP